MKTVVHLGAHKTATTYLQTLLARNVVALERNGVGYLHPKTLRPLFATAPRRNTKTERARRVASRAWVLKHKLENARDLQRKRMLISEELLIGSLRGLMQGRGLYRDAGRELRAVTSVLEGQPVTIAMALRSYETFFVSAYGQVLSGWKYIPFSDDLRQSLLTDSRGWPELLAEIMQALPPGSDLRVWRHEKFATAREQVLETLVGAPAASELQPFHGHPNPGPSQMAIDAIELQTDRAGPPGPDHIRHILRTFSKDKGFAPYDPWTPHERFHLQQRYLQDIALIRNLWPDALICDDFLGAGPTASPATHPAPVHDPPVLGHSLQFLRQMFPALRLADGTA